jgi:hypothetical protein
MSGISKKLMSAAGAGAPTDEFFNQTTLLLHGDGTNGGQNNTFLDGSTNNFTITRNGNTTQGSFNPYGDRWSNFFDGSGDYLAAPSDAAFGYGTGDFTVECWVYPTATQGNRHITDSTSAGGLFLKTEATTVGIGRATIATDNMFSFTFSPHTWYHVAFCRQGSTVYGFVDGVQIGSGSNTVNYTNPTGMHVGAAGDGSAGWNGYLSDVRVIKGTALYTAAFTPPTAPLTAISGTSLLTCQSNGFKDNSSNNFAITRFGDVKVTTFSPYAPSAVYSAATLGGSGYFDGTGDSLSVADDASLDFGTGEFTVEAWVYRTGLGTGATTSFESIIGGNGSAFNAWNLYHNQTNNRITWFGDDNVLRETTNTISNSSWNHVAVSRDSSSVLRIFINGVEGLSATVTTNYTISASGLRVGHDINANRHWFGYLSDVRVIKGTALYTAAFTPPTAPLTAVTNTSLLCSFTNAAIFDSTAKNVLETVGDAQIDTSVVKYGTGAMEFDGSGDWVVVRNDETFTGDFTIEFWVNYTQPSPAPLLRRAFVINANGNVANNLQFVIGTSGQGSGLGVWTSALIHGYSSAKNDGNWHHVAVSRASGQSRFFIDGVLEGSAVSNTTSFVVNNSLIGTRDQSTGSTNFNGYIDDLRITKGVARYTAAFTPPDRAFPDQ